MIIFSTLKTDCSELRLGWYRETSLSPPVIFLLTVPRRYFIRGFFFLFVFVFAILSCLCLAVLGSPAGKGLFSWLSCMWRVVVFLSLSHTMSWVRYGTWLNRFLIFAFFLTLKSLNRCAPVTCDVDPYPTSQITWFCVFSDAISKQIIIQEKYAKRHYCWVFWYISDKDNYE